MNQTTELEKSLHEARTTKIRVDQEFHRKMSTLSKKQRIPLAAFIRSEVLTYIAIHPLPQLAPAPSEEKLHQIKQVRPNALVYTVPVNGVKIVASEHPDGGWRGLLWKPNQTGSIAAWRSENLSPPPWAQTPRIIRTLLFVASRVLESGNESVYHVPKSNLFISAAWSGERFDGGRIVDVVSKKEQEWIRKDWYATMMLGPFSTRPNIRRFLNMLCRVLTVGNEGLTKLGE